MGIEAVAAHLVVLIAMASSGTVLVGVILDSVDTGLEAQNAAIQRLRVASNEAFTLTLSDYQNGPKRVVAEWLNDGSEEVRLDELTLLVDGAVTNPSTIERFQVQEDSSSNIWMPGETLVVWVKGQGDVDVGIVGPHGTASYRRA